MVTNKVTATVSTKGRHYTTLPLVITSLCNQTLKPNKLIVYDDNDTFEDLRENEIYKNLLMLMNRAGINWEIKPGARKGQIHNHQQALQEVTSEWIWRLDDDNIMDPNTLQQLFDYASNDPHVGAVGPLILDPKNKINSSIASNKIQDIYRGLNIQWIDTEIQSYIEVDHLQGSTFLFRKEAAKHGYDLRLSRVGHREETIFTYEMRRAGWKLVVLTGIKTWHMRWGAGGIRSTNQVELFNHDENIFRDYMENKWKIKAAPIMPIPLDSGIGDHYAFRQALPEIKKKHKGKKLVIGACYPEVFEGEEDVEIISLAEVATLIKVEDCNIYAWMDRVKWKESLAKAYKTFYTT